MILPRSIQAGELRRQAPTRIRAYESKTQGAVRLLFVLRTYRRCNVAISTFEGIVEDGKICIRDNVTLPENTKVYIVVPGLEAGPKARIPTPRLVHPEQADDFAKQVIEVPADAGL